MEITIIRTVGGNISIFPGSFSAEEIETKQHETGIPYGDAEIDGVCVQNIPGAYETVDGGVACDGSDIANNLVVLQAINRLRW